MAYPNARPGFEAEIKEIRAYTAAHDKLAACHQFCFDFRLGGFERAMFVVMGLNPGETSDDLATASGPVEESSLVDYRDGKDSRSRRRWFRKCMRMLGSDQIALSELCFWSSPDETTLIERIGPLELSPHLVFCRELNEKLVNFHKPTAVVLPTGLG